MANSGIRISRYLISKVITDKTLAPVIENKITPEWLDGQENQAVLEWIFEYYRRYAKVPTIRLVKTQFPNYRVVHVSEPFDVFIDAVRGGRQRKLVYQMLLEARDELQDNDDPKAALAAVQRYQALIGTEITALEDDDLWNTWEKRMERWRARRTDDKIVGIPTGFGQLDYATGGILPEHLITVAGLPKAGKSACLMLMAMAANAAGYSVLFISFEMSSFEQQARHDAYLAHLNSNKLLQGRLKDQSLDALEAALKKTHRRKKPAPFVLSTDVTATTTVSALGSKITEYNPDLVLVDGMYMMENEIGAEPGSEMAIRSISRSMKRLCQATKKPIIQSTQALVSKYSRSRGIQADTIGYTGALVQDSDLVLGVEIPDPEDRPDVRKLSIVAARNIPRIWFELLMDFENGTFEEVEGGSAESFEDDD